MSRSRRQGCGKLPCLFRCFVAIKACQSLEAQQIVHKQAIGKTSIPKKENAISNHTDLSVEDALGGPDMSRPRPDHSQSISSLVPSSSYGPQFTEARRFVEASPGHDIRP